MAQFSLPIFAIFAFFISISPCVLIAQPIKNPYENTDSFRLFHALKSPFSQFAKNVSMKSVLEDLARSHEIVFWIDRRVNGDQSISLSTDASATVQSTLEKLAVDCNCEIAYINQIVYFAPITKAAIAEFSYWNLALAAQTASTLKADRSRESVDLWQWSNPSEPTRLFRDRSQQQSFVIENMDLIEHDLWAPNSLPPSSFAAQWSCVLAGFGVTLLPSSQNQQQGPWPLIESPPPENVSFDYSPKQMMSVGKAEFTKWKEMWPTATVARTSPGLWKIDASVAAHRDFVRRANTTEIERLAGRAIKPKSKQSIENSRFSLKLQGTLSAVFTALRDQAGIEVTPWPLPANIGERRITLDLKEVTLDSLLQSLGQQANLEIIRQGKIVIIRIP
jgi:hypothetical protein